MPLTCGYLRGAGVDVFEMEPPLPMDHPLLHSINTIVTPHIAFASDDIHGDQAKIVFENIQKWMNKETGEYHTLSRDAGDFTPPIIHISQYWKKQSIPP